MPGIHTVLDITGLDLCIIQFLGQPDLENLKTASSVLYRHGNLDYRVCVYRYANDIQTYLLDTLGIDLEWLSNPTNWSWMTIQDVSQCIEEFEGDLRHDKRSLNSNTMRYRFHDGHMIFYCSTKIKIDYHSLIEHITSPTDLHTTEKHENETHTINETYTINRTRNIISGFSTYSISLGDWMSLSPMAKSMLLC